MNQPDPDRWFLGARQVTAGNDVQFFIYYRDFFRALAEDITKTVSDSHFIYISAWYLDINTALDMPDKQRIPLKSILQAASQRKVSIRALLMYQSRPGPPGINNKPAFSEIESLPTGAAILDNRYLVAGTHHQKIVVIYNRDGLIGYCGGMDIDEGRMGSDATKPPKDNPPPWADVHCRIKGEGAIQLLQTFCDRWQDHPWRMTEVPAAKREVTKRRADLASSSGAAKVQIAHTYPRGSNRKVLGIDIPNGLQIPTYDIEKKPLLPLISGRIPSLAPPAYAFAPNGDHSIYDLIVHCILKSKHTIYIEDQYLVGSSKLSGNLEPVSKILGRKVAEKTFKKLIILTNAIGGVHGELYQTTRRRLAFWHDLTNGLSNEDRQKKVGVFFFRFEPPPTRTPYLHSKIWIFDDEFAIIGSANCNRRGFSHDSEVAAGIAGADIPRKLRQELWFRHLNAHLFNKQPFTPLYSRQQLADFEQSSRFWFSPVSETQLRPYDFGPDPLNPDRLATEEAVRGFVSQVSIALRVRKALALIGSLALLEARKLLLDPDAFKADAEKLWRDLRQRYGSEWDFEWDNLIDPDGG